MGSETWAENERIDTNERIMVANTLGYWAHLSIYRFALPLAIGKRVLDAGSGEGYGAAYFARHGAASVLALDASVDAIAHARRRYADDPVSYEVADLNAPLPLADRIFDLVFSSNVFEHVGNVDLLAAECARVVSENGAVVVAVPPVTSAEALAAGITNYFHVHHIPPSAWQAKLGRFFKDVQFHRHFMVDGAPPDEWTTPAERVTIRETDFDFTLGHVESVEPNITAVFVCRQPRAIPEPETIAERTPADWREGEAFARVIAELGGQLSALRSELAAQVRRADEAEQRAAAFEATTSWRITAPLRAIVGSVRKRLKGGASRGAHIGGEPVR